MDFKELQYVLAIAKNNSISKAAKELYISQPSLSKYLQNLEKNLDLKLFERMGNNFILTYAGERYIKCAKDILRIKKNLDDEFFDILSHKKGRLNIACSIVRSPYIIPETVPKFKKLYPNVDINFLEETESNNLDKLVINGEADLAIFNYSKSNPMLGCELLKDEEITLVVGRNHPLAKEGKKLEGCKFPWIDIKRFKNDDFIVNYTDQKSGEMEKDIFDRLNINPKVVLKTRSVECSIRLAAHGFGVSFALETHLKYPSLEKSPLCFSIGNPNITTKLFAVYRKSGYLPQYLQDYISIVKQVV
ncbi:DNA-binding transcriptional LysR family regulator [Clostridium acetobutylicum]|uniref:Transcriptional regulator, LysR family n=1 Tax=Clostridium acetobutylicum (strain ATCC 824 / DSM 792 / JCM 1419 / IAM 19013 / LMG 5710 / NBRC 13948 / NRRL B-527 / VKM B-1787 / 2291 / W) TaxID=272562 RepID=Q97K73_CLOAB|nr:MULTISPECIES: LysR family transcriptional regulator [Clostridium]AAK79022.1 Transcriptional regulator, LysR family [Clostridium acetobutylicum ATCC 824]ADZ20097.1 Transcriptional regulator, LysR family [Clostridium acetobutylicum EA 2018]AEI33173.1 LysR family transcriptional regulator [Clostridium acetobutylicum DSM 1731]AWV81722.1 LysR family transcriptional regulator [Clostridium acetobutylicum]MBC2395264.1 LysR family transcriptional regulator [Clostridium acetobutylicum]